MSLNEPFLRRLLLTVCSFIALALPAQASRLVTAEWLAKELPRGEILLLDAQFTPQHTAKHIAGAVSADIYRYGPLEADSATMEKRIQSWGVNTGRKIVIYDQGGTETAPRLFFDLHYHGVPLENIFILDGGLTRWEATGGAVTKEATPVPAPGNFRIMAPRKEMRARLPEFLVATGEPASSTIIEALGPEMYYGATQFFGRPGHVPGAIMLPKEDMFNADKTFKSPVEIEKMMKQLGIRPEKQIHVYCGGGVAAAVPVFALRYLLGYPQVKLYQESLLEWAGDERGLPLWTESAPQIKRDASWLASWTNRMLRAYGMVRVDVIDVRSPEAYAQGHIPFAVNLPPSLFLDEPAALAAKLGPAGVNPVHEAVIVSEGGLTPAAALAFAALEKTGQRKVSILMDSVDEWGLKGFPLDKEIPKLRAVSYSAPATGAAARPGVYPKQVIAVGKTAAPGAIHLPYARLLNADRTPKPARELWTILTKAGVSRYSELHCQAEDRGEAAVCYYVLKLMGFPDVSMAV